MGSGVESQTGAQLLASLISLLALSSVSVILRLVARSTRGQTPGWDDVFVVIAWLLSVGIFVPAVLGVNRGWGQHAWNIPKEQFKDSMKKLYIFIVLWNPAALANKLSILAFYHRINPSQGFRRIVYLVSAFCVLFTVGVHIPIVAQCQPISYFWDRDQPGSCMRMTPTLFANTIFSVVADVVILLMPLPMVFTLKITTKQRIGLIVIFCIGIFTCLTASARFPFIHKFDSDDPLYDSTFGGLWSYAEVNCGIICACLPALRSLFRRRRRASDQQELTASGSATRQPSWPSEMTLRDAEQCGRNDSPSSSNHDTLYRVSCDDVVPSPKSQGAPFMLDAELLVGTDISFSQMSWYLDSSDAGSLCFEGLQQG